MTLTRQSVKSVGFGVLIEQILGSVNFMLIGPQENVSLIRSLITVTVIDDTVMSFFSIPKCINFVANGYLWYKNSFRITKNRLLCRILDKIDNL